MSKLSGFSWPLWTLKVYYKAISHYCCKRCYVLYIISTNQKRTLDLARRNSVCGNKPQGFLALFSQNALCFLGIVSIVHRLLQYIPDVPARHKVRRQPSIYVVVDNETIVIRIWFYSSLHIESCLNLKYAILEIFCKYVQNWISFLTSKFIKQQIEIPFLLFFVCHENLHFKMEKLALKHILVTFAAKHNFFWLLHLQIKYTCTIQTFNSCTSRPDVCQCRVQTPTDNMSREKLIKTHSNHPSSLRLKITFSCKVINASKPRKLVGKGGAFVYYAWAAQSFSAGIKCWHCT